MQPAAPPVAHGMIDRNLDILDLDAGFATLLGVNRDSVRGRPATALLHPDDREAAAMLLRHVWAGGGPLSTTLRHLRADRTTIDVIVHVSRLGEGDAACLVISCQPVSPPGARIAAVEAQWQMARLLLQALDGGKRAFGKSLIGNPATEFLLHAYVAEAEARALTAHELATRVDVSWVLTQRWLAALGTAGFIEAERSGPSAAPIERHTPIRLSPRALVMVEAIFASLVAVARQALVEAQTPVGS